MSGPSTIDLIANALFGWRHYRVMLRYKAPDGRELFSIGLTIGVRCPQVINQHRELKQHLGTMWEQAPSVRSHLCNGTLAVEPQCYLGRWKERAARANQEAK